MRRRTHTYERTAIANWLVTLGHDTSPLTCEPLPHKFLASSHFVRRRIARWREQHAAS